MSRTEEIAAILEEFIPRLEALKEEALREIGEASERASANIARHAQASEDLVRVEADIARLQAERETLPSKAYVAGLDGEYELEDRLTERYRNLKPAIESLEGRRAALRHEIALLNPGGDSHPNSATITQFAEVASVASKPRAELESLKKELGKALDASVGPVIQAHDTWRSTTWQMSHERAWDQSPVGQGAVQS